MNVRGMIDGSNGTWMIKCLCLIYCFIVQDLFDSSSYVHNFGCIKYMKFITLVALNIWSWNILTSHNIQLDKIYIYHVWKYYINYQPVIMSCDSNVIQQSHDNLPAPLHSWKSRVGWRTKIWVSQITFFVVWPV